MVTRLVDAFALPSDRGKSTCGNHDIYRSDGNRDRFADALNDLESAEQAEYGGTQVIYLRREDPATS
jgi:hypothetical protein